MLGIGFRMIVHPFKGDSHKLWFPSVALAFFFSNCCLYFLTSWSGGTKSASINLVLYWRLRMYMRQVDLWFWPKTPKRCPSHGTQLLTATTDIITVLLIDLLQQTRIALQPALWKHTLSMCMQYIHVMYGWKKITILVQAFKFRSIPKFIVTASVL